MDIWMIWAIAAVVLAIVEIFTPSFFSICLAFGALCAAIVAGVELGLSWQLVAFAVGATVAFVFARPVMMKYFLNKDKVKTGIDALVGRVGIVSEVLDPTGRVAIDGDDWRAIEVGGNRVAVGENVEVLRVESATVYVKKI